MLKFHCGLIIALLLTNSGFSHSEKCSCCETEFTSPHRPQEPTRPYPYDEEEVAFENTAAGITLAGTLTLPRSQGPFPVVVLIHGSGPLDRDLTMVNHKPFLVWADYLTRQGIAVLRFDKRSAGKSTGDYNSSTVEDFANDALAGVEYLKTREEINSNQIGLIGFSEGGLTAPLMASKSKDIGFIVFMAAPAVNLKEILYKQEELLQRLDGVNEEMIAENRQIRTQQFDVLEKEENRTVADQKLRDILINYLNSLTSSQRESVEKHLGTIEEQVSMLNSASFRYGLNYDPLFVLKQVKIPVLALNGDRDFIVQSEQNLKQIGRMLEETNHTDYTVKELPNLNHLFQTCQTGSFEESADIEETASPLALKIVADWILDKVHQNKAFSVF